jgi:hypothetical protein
MAQSDMGNGNEGYTASGGAEVVRQLVRYLGKLTQSFLLLSPSHRRRRRREVRLGRRGGGDAWCVSACYGWDGGSRVCRGR